MVWVRFFRLIELLRDGDFGYQEYIKQIWNN